MKREHKGIVVICTYKPKPGKKEALLEILKDHVPTLRMLGLASGYPRTLMQSENGAVIEIFEWDSEQASRSAHDNPKVKKIWDAIGKVADFVPFNTLGESQKPFAHFRQVENDRTSRVVHFEIEAADPKNISKFYQEAFGWEFHQWGENPYWLADTGREPCPGIDGAVLKKEEAEGGITNTIHVDSVDEAIKRVKRAGGSVIVPKMPITGVGYVAYGKDPEGNSFGMMEVDMGAQS